MFGQVVPGRYILELSSDPAAVSAVSVEHLAAERSESGDICLHLASEQEIDAHAVLIATAYGLYYTGSDALRGWISDLHIVVGLALPAGLILHVWLGRRSAPPDPTLTS